jgi:hypothetical protein
MAANVAGLTFKLLIIMYSVISSDVAVTSVSVTIDGSYLHKAIAPNQALSQKTIHPDRPFWIDFSKLDNALIAYARQQGFQIDQISERTFVSSIFAVPEDFEDWPRRYGIHPKVIERFKYCNFARERTLAQATTQGYQPVVYRPALQQWMLEKLSRGDYREKLVDTEVAVRTTEIGITRPDTLHIVLTGDRDITPALRYGSERILLAATGPGIGSPREWVDRKMFVLEEHVAEIMAGNHIYECPNCHGFFATKKAIPPRTMVRCKQCWRG